MLPGPGYETPEKFSHWESRSKFSKLMIIELFYSWILNMNRGSLDTRSFRRVHLSVIRYTKWLGGPERFPAGALLRETGPRTRFFKGRTMPTAEKNHYYPVDTTISNRSNSDLAGQWIAFSTLWITTLVAWMLPTWQPSQALYTVQCQHVWSPTGN